MISDATRQRLKAERYVRDIGEYLQAPHMCVLSVLVVCMDLDFYKICLQQIPKPCLKSAFRPTCFVEPPETPESTAAQCLHAAGKKAYLPRPNAIQVDVNPAFRVLQIQDGDLLQIMVTRATRDANLRRRIRFIKVVVEIQPHPAHKDSLGEMNRDGVWLRPIGSKNVERLVPVN